MRKQVELMVARHRKGEILATISDYLRSRNGGPASIAEVREAIQEQLGHQVPPSSVRSCLQRTRYFERTGPGQYRLRSGV